MEPRFRRSVSSSIPGWPSIHGLCRKLLNGVCLQGETIPMHSAALLYAPTKATAEMKVVVDVLDCSLH